MFNYYSNLLNKYNVCTLNLLISDKKKVLSIILKALLLKFLYNVMSRSRLYYLKQR